jgi:hypothetical protein
MSLEQEPAPQDSDDQDEEQPVSASDELVQLVASQANVSLKQAEEALRAENNEVVNAIMVKYLGRLKRVMYENNHINIYIYTAFDS